MTSRLKEGRLSTGIEALDEQSLKGIPKGSTIAVIGPTHSLASRYLAQIASTGRGTHYISMDKPKSVINREAMLASAELDGEKEIPENLKVYEYFNSTYKDNVVSYINQQIIQNVEPEQNFIIDTMNSFRKEVEEDEEYYEFIRNIHEATDLIDGLTFFYFADSDGGYQDLTNREQEALNIVDAVFLFEVVEVGNMLQTKLQLAKLRGFDEIQRNTFKLRSRNGQISIDSAEEM